MGGESASGVPCASAATPPHPDPSTQSTHKNRPAPCMEPHAHHHTVANSTQGQFLSNAPPRPPPALPRLAGTNNIGNDNSGSNNMCNGCSGERAVPRGGMAVVLSTATQGAGRGAQARAPECWYGRMGQQPPSAASQTPNSSRTHPTPTRPPPRYRHTLSPQCRVEQCG